ncbi:unnamed protein product [Penicillium salamii]|nr:unnamed protein product [Penicillium salamii]
MATLTEHPMQPASYEQDLDSFINFEQLTYTSDPARSKIAMTSQPSVASTEFSTSDSRSASFASSGQSPLAFQGPSHQYDEHRQQTGLPPGALSMTYNQVPMGFTNSQGFPVNADMYAGHHMKREEGPFDFNAAPARNPSEMDIESDSMNASPYFYPANPAKGQYVDPNALGGHELAQAGPSTQVGRMYPGMHQQQAAMAKAQQQKQTDMARSQVQPRAEQAPVLPQARGPRNPDPVVEERISRLLQQMRQNAMANGEGSPTPSNGMPQMAKSRKDEADMDEDERLLASEEGKKLSSKERRQLRNKVSARAFRSRRKEYIGQLESEVAARTSEAHEVRLQNRALYEENARLNDLARMLLGSPHFSNFLNEMEGPQQQQQQPQQPQQQAQQPTPQPSMQAMPKENTNRGQEFQMQQNAQPNMVMMPNQGMDPNMAMNTAGWNTGIDMNFGNTPVFAVMEVPEGPALDAEMLSGKSSSFNVLESSKNDAPIIEAPTSGSSSQSDIGVSNPDVEIDESDPAFALFVDTPASTSNAESTFEGIPGEKASEFELVLDTSNVSDSAKRNFNALCHSIDAAFERLYVGSNTRASNSYKFLPPKTITLPKLASLRARGLLLAAPNRAFTGVFLRPISRSTFLRTYNTSRGARKPSYPPRSAPRRTSRYQPTLNPSRDLPLRARQPAVDPKAYIISTAPLERYYQPWDDYLICEPSKFEVFSTPPKSGINPMKFFYQTITTPTADTPGTAIALNFPDKRYIFGQLSEGTQRACTERGVKLALLSDVFITGRAEWSNTGGLIGMILTLADTVTSSLAAAEDERQKKAARKAARGDTASPKAQKHGKSYIEREGESVLQKGNLTVHGPTNLTHTLATARRFVFRKGMPVYLKEYDSETMDKNMPFGVVDPFETPSWTDSNIKVWALPISPVADKKTSAKARRSQSPRKRSLDEFQETESDGFLDQRTKDRMTTQSIVQDMFNSTWKMDALHETPLAEVQMPAAMFVRNPETKDLEPYKGPVPGGNEPLPDITVLVRKPWPGATVENLPPTTPSKEAISYIVRNHDIRGKFDPKKAQEHNVEKGFKFAKLTKGESVESMDGKIVTPEMVLGTPRLGKGVAIMDVPSPEYVEDLVNRAEWNSPTVMAGLQAFIWILGSGVAEHPEFQAFVAKMSHCTHTVSGTDQCPNYLALTSCASSAVQLASLQPKSYGVPVHDNITLPQHGSSNAGSKSAVAALQNSMLTPLSPGHILDIEPNFGLNDEELMTRFNPHTTVTQIPRSVQQRLHVINQRVAKPDFQKKLQAQRAEWPGTDAEIIALGTGSSVPSKYRNVSATLINVPGYGYYLLDCGENTLGQMKRVFEPEELRKVLQNLRMIWISHLHADHHLGTATVIKAWYKENYKGGASTTSSEEPITKVLEQKRLAIVSDDAMMSWLEEYSQVEDFGFNKLLTMTVHPDTEKLTTNFSHRLPSGRRAQLSFNDHSSPLTPLLKAATGLEDILTCRVRHCKGALAVSLVFPNGFKVSYSGDCRPSEKFAFIGKDSTVLIHEATFGHDMVGSAIAKRHSTSAEAVEVGRRMRARAILLTHFSQRYQKVAYSDKRSSDKPNPRDAAAKEPVDADIPFDDPQDEFTDNHNQLSDDIAFSKNKSQTGPFTGPIAGAMDYMRVKVGDFSLAQAYAPTMEKLVDLSERAAQEATERAKQVIREQEEAKKAKNNKKFAKHAAAAAAAAAAVVVEVQPETQTELQKPSRSLWSASESESGWETSDAEL